MHTVQRLAKLVALFLAYLVLFLGGAAVLGPSIDPSALTAQEQALSGQMTLLVALIDLALVGVWVARARFGGLRLWVTVALVLYGVKTFSSQLETWYFIKAAHVPPEMLPRLFAMTLPLCVIWPALLVWALGPKNPDPPPAMGRSSGELALRVLVAGALLYPLVFFVFGYAVAWQNAAVRAYYEGPAQALPWLEHFAALINQDPLVLPFEMLRGLLWVAMGWAVMRSTRGPWWAGTLLFAAMMALVQNDLHLLPNPLMPAEVRLWHFIETASSNFLFALGAGALLRPRA